MNNLKLSFDSFTTGFVAFPITWYLGKAFGKQLWEDTKHIAYWVWDKVKSKAA